jgi:hypothetical protein
MVFRLAVVVKLTAAFLAVVKKTTATNAVFFTVFNRRYWYTRTGSLTIPIPGMHTIRYLVPFTAIPVELLLCTYSTPVHVSILDFVGCFRGAIGVNLAKQQETIAHCYWYQVPGQPFESMYMCWSVLPAGVVIVLRYKCYWYT